MWFSKGMRETLYDIYSMAGDFCHKAPAWPRLKRPDAERYKQPSCEILRCIMRKGGELTNLTLTLLLSVKPFIAWHSSAVSHTQGTKGKTPDILGPLLLTIRLPKPKMLQVILFSSFWGYTLTIKAVHQLTADKLTINKDSSFFYIWKKCSNFSSSNELSCCGNSLGLA